MDVSSSLLVALMFVMVLSIGIGNLLMGLSSLLNERSPREFDWLPTSWLLLCICMMSVWLCCLWILSMRLASYHLISKFRSNCILKWLMNYCAI